MKDYNRELLDFIEKSPTQFHAVNEIANVLKEHGFTALDERKAWEIKAEGKYFVTRNDSAIIAFVVPKERVSGFSIMASHSDSPNFRIKENPEMEVEGHYTKLNVERYGGSILSPWFDRPLSVAGRIIVKTKEGLKSMLVDIDQDLCMIVNLAIHMNREINDGYKYNVQKDLLPLYAADVNQKKLMELVAEKANVEASSILGSDLFLYNRQKGSIWGVDNGFISIGRLDDLQCAFGSLMGMVQAADIGIKGSKMPIYCVFDNEEVGSGTKQGADSTFLYDVLARINEACGANNGHYLQCVANSFMISADNAQALHPNYSDKSCPTNKVFINEGIAVKYSANQKYTTDGVSAAIFRDLCEKAGVKVQNYVNRSDMAGGSTLGNISTSHVSLKTVDIGLPQLAMHSPYETAGTKDTRDLVAVSELFFKEGFSEI